MCELIIEAWRQYFAALKQDLAIGHFILDNARNNDAAMRELSQLLKAWGITFDPMDRHIMCFPHILNICSGHVTGEYTYANFASISGAWVDALDNVIDKDAYMEALQRDPIALDIVDKKLDEMDWQVIQDMEVVLEVPHAAQQCMSGESLPLLSHAVPSFETFVAQWEHLSLNFPRCTPFIKAGLDYARTYYCRMGKTNAYAIAMLVDPCIRLTWIETHWAQADINRVKEMIVTMVSAAQQ
ncbi:hypothetical protein PAXINDRAFT_70562 [Paxillus involutus ATCC 200175]|nr:hypothetical protein PAXINDRAFT_70562 [Paxillus involutus ATCC 200175]